MSSHPRAWPPHKTYSPQHFWASHRPSPTPTQEQDTPFSSWNPQNSVYVEFARLPEGSWPGERGQQWPWLEPLRTGDLENSIPESDFQWKLLSTKCSMELVLNATWWWFERSLVTEIWEPRKIAVSSREKTMLY